jgi:hypothetical protein
MLANCNSASEIKQQIEKGGIAPFFYSCALLYCKKNCAGHTLDSAYDGAVGFFCDDSGQGILLCDQLSEFPFKA